MRSRRRPPKYFCNTICHLRTFHDRLQDLQESASHGVHKWRVPRRLPCMSLRHGEGASPSKARSFADIQLLADMAVNQFWPGLQHLAPRQGTRTIARTKESGTRIFWRGRFAKAAVATSRSLDCSLPSATRGRDGWGFVWWHRFARLLHRLETTVCYVSHWKRISAPPVPNTAWRPQRFAFGGAFLVWAGAPPPCAFSSTDRRP